MHTGSRTGWSQMVPTKQEEVEEEDLILFPVGVDTRAAMTFDSRLLKGEGGEGDTLSHDKVRV